MLKASRIRAKLNRKKLSPNENKRGNEFNEKRIEELIELWIQMNNVVEVEQMS